MTSEEAARLSDAQARTLITKALRRAKSYYQKADTAGEKLEREFVRLIQRKTRINATQLVKLAELYQAYGQLTNQVQLPLRDAYQAAAIFGS